MSNGSLAGRRVVVTGGGRGIGRAVAERFAAEGADVMVTARSTDQLDEVVAASGALPGRIVAQTCDVSSAEDVAALVEAANRELAGVDTVVNNAGVHAAGRFMELGPEIYQQLFDINVVGTLRVSQAFLPAMIDAGFGRIINIASTAGLFESPNQAPYNTTKHAVVGMTRCMALELAPTGVTANAICPGFVDTPMLGSFAEDAGISIEELRAAVAGRTPMKRILDPAEIAHLAVYLASDLAGGMTGQTIAISNGMRMH